MRECCEQECIPANMPDFEQRVIEQRIRQQKKELEEDSKWLQEEESNFKKRLSCSDRSDKSDTDSLEGISSSPVHSSSGVSNHDSPVSRDQGNKERWKEDASLGSGDRGHFNNISIDQAQITALPSFPDTVSEDNDSTDSQSSSKKLESLPTADIDRTDDKVYENTTNVVRAIMQLSKGVQMSKQSEYLELVKKVGMELRCLLGSVDEMVAYLPKAAHRNIEMAHKVLSKDMHELVNAMKLAQQNSNSTAEGEFRKKMLSAGHVLAMDAKNLLDVVDASKLNVKTLENTDPQNNNTQKDLPVPNYQPVQSSNENSL